MGHFTVICIAHTNVIGCRKMYVYAPEHEQPVLGRSLMELTEEEQPIYQHFRDKKFVDKLLSFLSLEENKGKDKFHPRHFTLFKVHVADVLGGLL